MAGKMRWGDTLEDEDLLPPTSVSGPNDKGVKTVTEYLKKDNGDVIKRITKFQITNVEKKVYKVSAQRKAWPKFGDAASSNEGVTMQTTEDIPFERTNLSKKEEDEKKPADFKAAFASGDKASVNVSIKEMLERRRMERQLMRARGMIPEADKPPEEDGPGGSGGAPKPGSYVPPSRRGEGTSEALDKKRRDENSVRVTNLSDDAREADLMELFRPFGPISRVYIAYDRETRQSRGFGFVNFMQRDHAAKAIEMLDGHGYDNLILRVEWATPRAERN